MADDPIPNEDDLQRWFLGERRHDILALLQRGIEEKRKVLACLRGDKPVVFYPHAIGRRQHQHFVRVFFMMTALDVIGEPFDSPQRWRWLPVADIELAQLADRWGSLPVNPPPPPAGVEITVEATGVL